MNDRMSLYVMSHLSDAQELVENTFATKAVNRHINFAKFLIGKSGGDLTKEYSTEQIDEFWNEFKEMMK